jgi:replication initiator protein
MIPDQLGLFDDSLPTEISDLGLEALQRKMPAKLKRVINTANEVMSALPERADFLHAVLCQVGMPRRRIIERSFERYSGAASIKLTAGELYQRGQWVPQPLPYGAHPRLVMVHISGVAVRSRSRVIPIGESMRDFLIALGIPPNGGKTGGYTMFKRQMQALAACRLQLGMSIGQLDRTITTQPIERFDAWFTPDSRQRSLWPNEIELSEKFYDTLVEHAVPLDHRALAAIKHSALALDIYSWLAHRLCRIAKPAGVKVSWGNLKEQFGQEYRLAKDFKKEFRQALRQVCAVYPAAGIEETLGGLVLRPSKPPIARTAIVSDRR